MATPTQKGDELSAAIDIDICEIHYLAAQLAGKMVAVCVKLGHRKDANKWFAEMDKQINMRREVLDRLQNDGEPIE